MWRSFTLTCLMSLTGLALAAWGTWTGDTSMRDAMKPVIVSTNSGTKRLFVSPFEVTWKQWQACHEVDVCQYLPPAPQGGDDLPVTGVNWFDVQEFLVYANQRSRPLGWAGRGATLRLPTLAEWRQLHTSLDERPVDPAFTDPRLEWAANYGREKTSTGPVRAGGSFSTTPDGIADLDGNVWEWTASCKRRTDAEPEGSRCPAYVAAGEHEAEVSVFVRNPALGGCATGRPPTHLGLRLVADQ